MKRIIITVPQGSKKWMVTVSSGCFKRKSAANVYNYVERKLLAKKMMTSLGTSLKDKTAARVKYDKEYHNESLASKNTSYLLYTLSCFLEDYLSQDTLNNKEKLYGGEY